MECQECNFSSCTEGCKHFQKASEQNQSATTGYVALLNRWMDSHNFDPYKIVGKDEKSEHPLNAFGVLRRDTMKMCEIL